MAIKTSLISLSEAVNNGIQLEKGLKVKLPLHPEAYVYGFVAAANSPFCEYIDTACLGNANVISNRIVNVIDGKFFRFPIFKSVRKATDERYELKYLYVPRFLHLPYESHVKAYRLTMMSENPSPYVVKLEKNVKIFDNIAYYYPKEGELYFASSSLLHGIAESFEVVTRRVSINTDQLIYEVYNPEEVMMEKK